MALEELAATVTKFTLALALLLADIFDISTLVQAKGVAGLGKAGGDGQGGSDKAGQQVPPEVYNALTYAGTAFLFTLSVPVILYGLNKLLNKIEDCFGCGPSSKKKALLERHEAQSKKLEQQHQSKLRSHLSISNINGNMSLLSQQQGQPPGQALPDSAAITLPLDYTPNFIAPTLQHTLQQQLQQQQQQQQRPQPYIISSPHL